MNHLVLSALVLVAVVEPVRAADQASPAATNVPGAPTPSIHADHSITFTLKAPEARTVQVAGGDGLGAGPFPMTKDAEGTWKVTTPPAVPGFHYYWFVLDGVSVNDPSSETFFGYGKETSGVEVPESGAAYYAITDVPHGEVREKRAPGVDVKTGFSAFEEVIVHDLIPTIDASYRTIPEREHRAMAGLSMGGMQTLFIALHRLDLFAYLGSLSGPIYPDLNFELPLSRVQPRPFDTKTAYEGAFANPSTFNSRVKLFWLGVGTAEPERIRAGIGDAVRALKQAGVRIEYFESAGTAHEWQTWRRDLNDFVPRLFR